MYLKNNQFEVQIGIKAYVINLNDLFAIYRRDLKSQGVTELTLAYKQNKKIKRARIYADKGEEEFEAFHHDLKQLKPAIDISDLPEKSLCTDGNSRSTLASCIGVNGLFNYLTSNPAFPY